MIRGKLDPATFKKILIPFIDKLKFDYSQYDQLDELIEAMRSVKPNLSLIAEALKPYLDNYNNYDEKGVKKFLIGFIVLFLFSPLAYAYVSLLKDDKRTDYPGKEISQKVQKKWDNDFTGEINVVLGDEWTAGNLSYHLKSRPMWEGKIDKNKLNAYNKFLCIDNICVGNK